MRFLIPILLISVNSFGQQSDRDSILNSIDTIYFGEQFISYDIGIKFVKGTSIIKQTNSPYLDSVSDYLGKYGECTCDLYLGHYNKVRNRLNKRRIIMVQNAIHSRIDSSLFHFKIYGNKHPDEFDVIFGTDQKSIRYFQQFIYVKVNCSNSLYLVNQKTPINGFHGKTYSTGEIQCITQYVNGVYHGKSFCFSKDGNLTVMRIYENGTCTSTLNY